SNWNAASQRSLDLFNKHAGMKLEVMVASVDALDAVKSNTARVCPLICDHGFKADGDRCAKITCRAGYDIGDDNTCEKIEVKKPTAKRDEPKAKRESSERTKVDAAPPKPQASGQIICSQQGCRPVQKGCHLGEVTRGYGSNSKVTGEVCN
ncbi:MAG TPA: caspase family protein, partial [Bradyrhizobium sp.]|nr:caspase family protein [Bradyrhizobium sp.]